MLTVHGSGLDTGSFEFVIENAVPAGWWQVNTSGAAGLVTVFDPPDREHPVRLAKELNSYSLSPPTMHD